MKKSGTRSSLRMPSTACGTHPPSKNMASPLRMRNVMGAPDLSRLWGMGVCFPTVKSQAAPSATDIVYRDVPLVSVWLLSLL